MWIKGNKRESSNVDFILEVNIGVFFFGIDLTDREYGAMLGRGVMELNPSPSADRKWIQDQG